MPTNPSGPGVTRADERRSRRIATETGLSDEEARALVSVAVGLAEDFDIPCAVVVLDVLGDVRLAERSGRLPGPALASAIDAAHAALAGHCVGRPEAAAAIVLRDEAGLRGALGVAGGPDGFGLEACRHAGRALGLI
jgi:hypothetical protein